MKVIIFISAFLYYSHAIASDYDYNEISSVQQKLDEKAEKSAAKHTDAMKNDMKKANAEIAAKNLLENAVKTGDKAPDFTLRDIEGNEYNLYNLLEEGPVVLTWYRGGWCPYCNIYLRSLSEFLPEFEKRDTTLVAISPEKPVAGMETAKANDINFIVLTDDENKIADKYGIVFDLPEILVDRYKDFEINVAENNNSDKHQLPLPAAYVLDQEGNVVYSFVDLDYKKRAEPKEILKAIDSIYDSEDIASDQD